MSSTPEPSCSHPARGIVNKPCLCRTYRTRWQLGPSHPRRSCSGEFPEPHFRCSWAPGKGTKEPFSSPASSGVEGEGKRKDQCLQNMTIGRKFSSGFSRLVFFVSLFLFLKRAGTASGQFKKTTRPWPATSAMCSHSWADDPLLHWGSTSQMVNDAVVFQRGKGMEQPLHGRLEMTFVNWCATYDDFMVCQQL